MHLRSFLYTCLVALFGFVIAFQSGGCANIVSPMGGPKDTLPPVLVNVNPGDSTLQFKGNRINFTFSEYVTVTELTNNLIVSPTPNLPPQIDSRLRTVTIRIKDTLEENTTYSFNFGNAIRDVNEGNVLKDFTYLFSTGNRLDDNELQGTVTLAETGGVDSTIIVMLHRSGDDSALIKERPRYYTRLDSSGNFHFRNLPAETFYLYALKDEGGQRRYMSKSQLFAFADQPQVIGDNNPPIRLFAYAEELEEKRPTTGRVATPVLKTAEEKRLRFQTNVEGGQQDLLDSFDMTFPTPLKILDTSKFRFTDEKFVRVPNYTFLFDSTRKVIQLVHSWTPNTAYKIILDKDFAEDSLGRKLLKTDTIDFRTKKIDDYGSIHLKFTSLDLTANPVLQLVNNGKLVYSHVFTNNEFNIRLFNPGDYDLRILYDANKNGKWDPGEFFGQRRQPERVVALRTKLNVKAKWDRVDTIQL
jgi:hypothetical protein